MDNKIKITTKGEGFLNGLFAMLAVCVIICCLMITAGAVYSVQIKDELKNSLGAMPEELKIRSGASRVEVKVGVDPTSYFNPLFNYDFYPVFLIAHIDSIDSKTNDEWMNVLTVEGGDSKVLRYFPGIYRTLVCAETLSVENSSEKHPVYMVLTDGAKTYGIVSKDSFYDSYVKPIQETGDLHVNKLTFTSGMCIFVALLSIGLMILIKYKLAQKDNEIKKASIRYYVDCFKLGIKDASQLNTDALKAADPYVKEHKIKDIARCYGSFYRLGQQEKQKVFEGDKTNLDALPEFLEIALQEIDADICFADIEAKREAKTKKTIRICIEAAVIIVIAIIVVKAALMPYQNYTRAQELLSEGKTDDAYYMLKELGWYFGADDICQEIEYDMALDYEKKGQYAKAYDVLDDSKKNEKSASKREELLKKYPYLGILDATPGGTVEFGSYEQDNNKENGSEPIVWFVAHKSNGNIILVSKYVLDAQPYNVDNTEDCTLYDWLKNWFQKNAFEELNISEDIIYTGLITKELADDYLQSDYFTNTTEYAKNKYDRLFSDGDYEYWIDDGVYERGDEYRACVAGERGRGTDYEAVTEVRGVRPVVWICTGGA
ncbi:MAG: hypothetical protein HUJ98_01870, partial [Bacteroidaceae bacterium]|nr:hypothetical protein [Bacteroidaceae bacterium]